MRMASICGLCQYCMLLRHWYPIGLRSWFYMRHGYEGTYIHTYIHTYIFFNHNASNNVLH
jgi:hypothetical protein